MTRTAALMAVAGMASAASAQLTISPTTTPYSNITALGSFNSLAAADDSEHTVTAAALGAAGFTGNGLLPGGVNIRIGNNGAVLWGNSAADAFTNATEVGFTNANIMTMAATNSTTGGNGGLGPRQFVCAFWDDVIPAATSSGVTTRVGWAVVGGNLVIEWEREDLFPASTNPNPGVGTFQMIVYSTGTVGAPLVDFVYEDTIWDATSASNDGGSASIGYKNWGGPAFGNDVQWSFNTVSVAGWTSGPASTLPHALRIVPTPGALALLGVGGLLAARRRR